MNKRPMILVIITMAFFVFSGTIILQRCKPKDKEIASLQAGKNKFIGEQSCKSCHAKQYDDWLKSDHFMAMQPPNDSTVKGNFNNVSFTADGVTS
jgi:predicted metal-dependent hydrolase